MTSALIVAEPAGVDDMESAKLEVDVDPVFGTRLCFGLLSLLTSFLAKAAIIVES